MEGSEMSVIDAKAFAANLRAEMGRMGYKPTLQRLCDLWFEAFPKSDQVYHQNWLARIIDGQDAPSNIVPEVEALANALGCPVERLTVSREELEAEVERISVERDHYREEASALREIIEMPTMAQYALGAGTPNEKRHSYGCPHCRKVNPIGQMCGCVGRRLEALEAENDELKARWEAFHTGTEIIVPDWVQRQISEEAKRRRERYDT